MFFFSRSLFSPPLTMRASLQQAFLVPLSPSSSSLPAVVAGGKRLRLITTRGSPWVHACPSPPLLPFPSPHPRPVICCPPFAFPRLKTIRPCFSSPPVCCLTSPPGVCVSWAGDDRPPKRRLSVEQDHAAARQGPPQDIPQAAPDCEEVSCTVALMRKQREMSSKR